MTITHILENHFFVIVWMNALFHNFIVLAYGFCRINFLESANVRLFGQKSAENQCLTLHIHKLKGNAQGPGFAELYHILQVIYLFTGYPDDVIHDGYLNF